MEINQEPDPGVKGEVEFSLYSKFNGKPLKGFKQGAISSGLHFF